jgi:putative spermidine/putrescine transport system ATP-binding protein
VRPENVRLADATAEGENAISARVTDVMCVGSKTHVHGVAEGEDRVLCELPAAATPPTMGEAARFVWPIADTLIYEVGA